MGIILQNQEKYDKKTVHFTLVDNKNLLLIFVRNPEMGKCKTRLAATVGDEAAFNIYNFLLQHTAGITRHLSVEKQVWYSERISENDLWDKGGYVKKLQQGTDLGERMANAFLEGFEKRFEKIVIIGSDMYDLDQSTIEDAFLALNDANVVLGPADDGGYYLLGMKKWIPELFKNKDWGQKTVLADTLSGLKNEKTFLLDTRNDIDIYEDIEHLEAFKPFIKHMEL